MPTLNMKSVIRRRPAAPAALTRKAPHVLAPRTFGDGATDELRDRVAYAICAGVYSGRCACQQRKATACSAMLSAASSAILIVDEARPF